MEYDKKRDLAENLERPFNNLCPEEKAIVFEFVGYFSRLEYSMKRAGYVLGGDAAKADVDWQAFANRNEAAFEGCDLQAICPTLYEHPPKKQVLDQKGNLDWQDVQPQGGAASLRTLSLSLMRARNNLFHGAKYHVGGDDFGRSNILLKEGVELIKHLVSLDKRIERSWNAY